MARSHYENFPVGSLLVPRGLRKSFYALYAWSRAADDIADEGTLSGADRVARLDRLEADFERARAGTFNPEWPFLPALVETVRRHNLEVRTVLDLLVAFRRDATGQGFDTREALLDYCRYSANPVGRLLLELFGLHDDRLVELSDSICTGLQLANFLQDLSIDLPRGRVNLPRDLLAQYGWEADGQASKGNGGVLPPSMVLELVALGRSFLDAGEEFRRLMPIRRLRWEIVLVVTGGRVILDEIAKSPATILLHRPTVSKRRMVVSALRGEHHRL